MLVAVHPERPSVAITTALLDAGYRPVPVSDLADVGDRSPERGWAGMVVELGPDPVAGLALARRVRESLDVPVLLVAGRDQLPEVAAGEYDDFVLTPLDADELAIRLRRIGSSDAGDGDGDEVIRFKDLELNLATYQATLASQPVDLTYMEYELLRFFATNPAKVWSRDQILSKVWGYDYFGGSRTVDVHVRRLRAKLGEERASWITTVRSVGYRFG